LALTIGVECDGGPGGSGCPIAAEFPPTIPSFEVAMPSREQPDAIALLKADHRKVEDLFAKFEKAREAQRKQALVQQICTELSIHATLEEEIFYPACKDRIEDEDVLEEAYVEHDGAKVLIAELLDSEPDAEFYDAKVSVLSEMIKHHIKEEEKRSEGLLAQAREAGLDMAALGRRLQERKQELIREFADGNLPPPKTRTFTGHTLEQAEPVEAPASHP
jgi:hypothetical protein